MTIGDETTVNAKIYEKFSSAKSRFIGEIIIANPDLEVTAERNWFVDSPDLEEAVKNIKEKVVKLYNIAEEDSSLGVGMRKKIDDLDKINKQIKNEETNKNVGKVEELTAKKDKLENSIRQKSQKLNFKIKSYKDNKSGLNQEETLKFKILKETKAYLAGKSNNIIAKKENLKEERKSPVPEILKTLITKRIIAPVFEKHVLGKNLKDTTDNIFSIIETALKEKLNKGKHDRIEFDDLIKDFFSEFEPPPDDVVKYHDSIKLYSDIKSFLLFMHRFFRNPTIHTISSAEENTAKNIIRILIMGDFALQLINSWSEKIK